MRMSRCFIYRHGNLRRVTAESIAGDCVGFTSAAPMLGHHISLSACCNVVSAFMVAATVAAALLCFDHDN
jgi:hypothetical protein